MVRRGWLAAGQKWAVFGGSNGATLALLYAARYTSYVSGVVTRGYWSSNSPVAWSSSPGCRVS